MKIFFTLSILFFTSLIYSQTIPCNGEAIVIDQSTIQSDTIASSDSLHISSQFTSGQLRLSSPILICLENGFEVQLNAELNVVISDCSTGFNFSSIFGNNIDLNNPFNYANQIVPAYISKDNTGTNDITDHGATLGRVLFYDKNLSLDGTISCASCHQQNTAFSDPDISSTGIDGTTGRHSMRLMNTRFATEVRFFWDERAASLEAQSTQPIQDHIEMGFSGTNGQPALDSLLSRMSDLEYYPILFDSVFNSTEITEGKMQLALAQFIRSIQSFDSPFDIGRAQVNNNGAPFPNFNQNQNNGKNLFLRNVQTDGNGSRIGGGLGCNRCHRAPEFDIDEDSRNNGVIGVIGNAGATDVTNERAPSLRDLFGPGEVLNGPMMHDGSHSTIDMMIDHYNSISVANNNNLDNRLRENGQGQQLNITAQERSDLIEFMKTLTGSDVYTNAKWSNPFIN